MQLWQKKLIVFSAARLNHSLATSLSLIQFGKPFWQSIILSWRPSLAWHRTCSLACSNKRLKAIRAIYRAVKRREYSFRGLWLARIPWVARLPATKLLAASLVCHSGGKNSPLHDQMRIHMHMCKAVVAAGRPDLPGFDGARDC